MVVGENEKHNSKSNAKNRTTILFVIIQKNEDIMQSIRYKQKIEKQATYPKELRGTIYNRNEIIPWHFNWTTYVAETWMLNHVHNNDLHNTDDGVQAIGEELKHLQMSRWILHIGERSKQQYEKVMRWVEINPINITFPNKSNGKNNFYPPKSWRCNTITQPPQQWSTTVACRPYQAHSITDWGWINRGRNIL